MKLSFWMAAKAIVEVVFGIGFVLAPVLLGSLFALDLDPAGALMAQLFGVAFLFGCLILWTYRNAAWSDVRRIVVAVVVTNAIGFIITLLATLSGVWNVLGWLPVVLYLVFGLVFAYFLFIKKSP